MSPALSFAPADFFAFRTPTLPFEVLEGWSTEPSPTLEGDREALRSRLREAVARPEIRDALFLASPDLEEMLEPWLAGRLAPDKRDRVDQSLVRYLSRMAWRCTPFGLFAGCSVGRWSGATQLATQAREASLRHTRLDMDYLCALVEALEKDPVIRRVLHYRPNTSLYTAAGRLRYAEGRLHAERGRDYHLVALDKTPYLEETLARASAGATIAALAEPLATDGITLEEAAAFVEELIDSQVLVSDLYPAITGPEPIHGVLARLRAHEDTEPFAQRLEAIRDALQAMDDQGLGVEPARYRNLATTLEELPAKIKLKFLFQVDLVKPAPEAALGGKVRAAICEAVELLRRLTPARPAPPFKDFKAAFRARYEERWVPLLEVLDDETGIGLNAVHAPGADASPLLEGLNFPAGAASESHALNERSIFMLRRVLGLVPGQAWDLSEADLKVLENPDPGQTPDAFACTASVAAASPEAVDAGAFQLVMKGFFGPSGARLLGRFCHGDPELSLRVEEHLKGEAELKPEAIFAEIVHLPEGRMGNILCRPLVRGHEIVFLGVSGSPDELQIPVSDLEVSIQGDQVVLRSRKLGKQIIPRLTSAHNYSRGLGIYRFLCSLQEQGASGGGWSWGALEALPFLPRVQRGRHVLQVARWLLLEEELKPLAAARPDEAFQLFRALAAKRGLPRLVQLADGDNELLVDLENPLWVDTLLHLVVKRPSFILQECFPGPGELLATGPEGRFCHELVVPFLRLAPVQAAAPKAPLPRAEVPAKRSFMPGSEWLSLKLYTGTSSADQLLLQALSGFLEAQRSLFDRWFFIRYNDPDHHLRLRFHGEPEVLAGTLLPRLHKLLEPFQEAGLLWKLQADTYEREVERYGGPQGVQLAEELFCHDSQAVLDLVQAYPGDEGADMRWRMGLKAVDSLLDDLGFDLATKAKVIHQAREGFSREFQANKNGLDVQLGTKFRAQRKALEGLLFEASEGGATAPGLAILAARSQALRPCLEALREAEATGTLQRPRQDLVLSYTHMHLNRLLRAAQRAQEFVIYDFLDRLYESRLARVRKAAPVSGLH